MLLQMEVTKKENLRASPVVIPDHVWYNHLDPIDKEIHYLLDECFPRGYSAETLLSKLKQMNPEENEEYRLQDVWDSLDISLKDYVTMKGRGFWALKRKT
jgi:hypothetical protein